MDIAIAAIEKNKDVSAERVGITVKSETNIMNYIMLSRPLNAFGNIFNVFEHVYRFPDLIVKPNDYIILVTGSGENSKIANKAKGFIYTFFWNQTKPLWDEFGRHPCLVQFIADEL